jgi:hypothetical protein
MKENQNGYPQSKIGFGKSFWYHGIHDFLKTQVTTRIIENEKKTNHYLKYYYFNNVF